MKKNYLFIIALIILILLSSCGAQTSGKKQPQAKNGVLDLRDWDFEKDGIVNLTGEWEFYWKKFLMPKDFEQEEIPTKTGFVKVPGIWDIIQIDGKNQKEAGIATFRLRILHKRLKKPLALKIRSISPIYTLYQNGKKIIDVKPTPESTFKDRVYSVTFSSEGDETVLVLHPVSFGKYLNAIQPILLGLDTKIRNAFTVNVAIDLFISGMFMIVGLYHIIFFLFRKRDISLIAISLVSINYSLWMLFGELTELSKILLFPDLRLSFSPKMFYMTSILCIFSFTWFCRILFPEQFPRKIFYPIAIPFVVFVILVPFLPPNITAMLYFYFLSYWKILGHVVLLYVILLATLRRIEGAFIVLIGSAGFNILSLMGNYHILINNWNHNFEITFTLAAIFFVFSQAIALAYRFSKTSDRVEVLSTELQIKSNELEQKNTKLLELDKLKDDFLSSTSHELRTPLNGIIGIAESLYDGAGGAVTNQIKSNLSMIVTSGKRLSNLVNDILDFSKLKNQTIEIQKKSISIKTLTDVVITLSQPLLAGKTIDLKNKLENDIPSVLGDENRLQQILFNLVGNAIKFTDSGEVNVAASVNNQMVEITVSDTGIGIPEDKFENIFKSFEQVDSSIAREYAGTGIGLSISKQLVELHGGQIWVESDVGKGSKFTFSIPISAEHAVSGYKPSQPIQTLEIDQKEADIQIPIETKRNGEFHILIVDDDPINLQVLENHLSLQKYSVTQASNGEAALKAVEEKKPDLVLLDIMMPGMSGYEVCEKLREIYPASQLPVLMLTAKNQVSDLIDGFNSGANDYIPKPFSKNELLTRVKAHLELSQSNRAYTRFVPQEFLKLLKRESIVEVKLGENVQMDMSILFADIRSFTTMSEKMTPQENFAFLNSYLEKMAPVVNRHNGFIDKYLGDGLMALFSTNADDAVVAGIDMLDTLSEFNKDQKSKGLDPIKIGIGINTGNMMLGTIGDSDRMDGTVVSDDVNLASRLEDLTKEYGASLIISERTYNHLVDPSKYALRALAYVQPKGKSETVKIFEVCDADPPKIKDMKLSTVEQFERAVTLFNEQKHKEAEELFQDCLEQNPKDRASQIYMVRCQGIARFG